MPLPLKHLLASCMFALGLGMAAPAVAQGQTPGQPQMPSQNRSGQPVDLDLVLLADSTGSIDDREIFFQRQGYADAITDPDILSAIALGPDQKIAVTYVEWGNETSQEVVVPWTIIDGAAAAAGFRSEEHTSEIQSLMRISSAVFCLNNKKTN